MKLTIASRKSKLALWQSEYVAAKLRALGHECEILELSTKGDEVLDRALSAIGGKNLFIKELETAMYEGRAQLAVHSLKDVGAELAYDFQLAAVCAREDEADVIVFGPHTKARSLAELPAGARIGTTSLRRCLQLKLARADLELISLRGNLQTRLSKLNAQEFDAIVLAYAGLARLELLEGLEYARLDTISAAGQGAVAIEAINDPELLRELKRLECPRTRALVSIERDFTRVLNGGCGAPIGINASVQGSELVVKAIVGNAAATSSVILCERVQLDASVLRAWERGEGADALEALQLGQKLAQRAIAAGAKELIEG